jgi:hypothetical protein
VVLIIHKVLHLSSIFQTFFFQTSNLLPSFPELSNQSLESVIARWSAEVEDLNRLLHVFPFIFLLNMGSVYHLNKLLNAFSPYLSFSLELKPCIGLVFQ